MISMQTCNSVRFYFAAVNYFFGKIHFLLILENQFFHEIKLGGITSLHGIHVQQFLKQMIGKNVWLSDTVDIPEKEVYLLATKAVKTLIETQRNSTSFSIRNNYILFREIVNWLFLICTDHDVYNIHSHFFVILQSATTMPSHNKPQIFFSYFSISVQHVP